MEQDKQGNTTEGRQAVAISSECAAVLQCQETIAGLEAQLDRVMAAITEQRGNADRWRTALPDAKAINARFDDLLAKLATGEANDEDVAREEEKVRAVRAEIDRIAPEVERAERTVTALAGRANAYCDDITKLKQEKADLITRFLIAEAQAECKRYVEAGLAASAAYTRLLSLDSMLQRRGLRPLHAHGPEMFLPRFDLDVCNAQRGHWFLKGALFAVDQRFDREACRDRVAAEYKALQDAFGIEFDD